jgi:hypothetical protein
MLFRPGFDSSCLDFAPIQECRDNPLLVFSLHVYHLPRKRTPVDADREKRRQIFAALIPHFGKIMSAGFLKQPKIAGIDRIHPLIEGIYKPAWSNFALSIVSMLKSPYSDQAHHNSDGTWWMHYSPKSGSMDLSANASLIRCMTDSEPLLVVKQVSDKNSKAGAKHRLLGLGLVEVFEPDTQLFRIRGVAADKYSVYLDLPVSDELLETTLRLGALEDWRPFLQENRIIYTVNAEKRDRTFRSVVLNNYDSTCAVTGQKFVFASAVEADAAHIIDKCVRGTDDPRNGLALSRTAHWAFDQGIFTVSDQYEVLIHPQAHRANWKAFPILEAEGKRILLPVDPLYYPHQEALSWHREERFGRFSKS